MTDLGMFNAVVYGLSAFFAAFAALTLLSRGIGKTRKTAHDNIATSGDAMIFLLREDRLIDANFSGHRYLDAFGKSGGAAAALRRAVHTMFDDGDALLTPAPHRRRVTGISRDGTLQAMSETLGQTLRVKIRSRLSETGSGEDIHRLAAQEAELETLRETTDSAPCLVWRETPNGVPIWVNRAYLDTVGEVFGDDRAGNWPLPRLFAGLEPGVSQRKSIIVSGEAEPRWYECHSVPVGNDRLFTAFNANSIVKAEAQLRDFMQTLTKTFSQLTVGLAIFDRSRNLRLFNPALTELTALPVDFLARRPKLTDFLDGLRENRMMPEPKDYKEWRTKMAELEAAAESGSYSETWSLPGNLTYRVTGRPHPDGAIAFLFEDISAEMTLTRQFRREIEVSQSLLDNMDDATAHFSRDGAMVQSNRAYRRLWSDTRASDEQEPLFHGTDVIAASRTWLEATEPTPVWGDVRDFVLDSGERTEWSAEVTLLDGRGLDCRFVPMPGGGSQLIFRVKGARVENRARVLELV